MFLSNICFFISDAIILVSGLLKHVIQDLVKQVIEPLGQVLCVNDSTFQVRVCMCQILHRISVDHTAQSV